MIKSSCADGLELGTDNKYRFFMTTKPSRPVVPVGQYRTFGAEGPVYQVVGMGHESTEGEWLVPIRVVESGEELDYRYSRFAKDPEAR